MSDALLLTKFYIPPPRPNLVLRPRLVERLNGGLSAGCKLTLISAPAGFGKSTLVSEWIASPRDYTRSQACSSPAAWLSLDEADSDPARFILYLIATLQTIKKGIGASLIAVLQSSQPFNIDALLTALLNEISLDPEHFVLVLDDYHAIDSPAVDKSLNFLVEHLPPQMHLVITTREDPQLPLARYRTRGQLTELRASDLRFTTSEAAEFLNQVTGLGLSEENIAALETRTEGWIAGLQLAAISMQGQNDAASFIQSFTGSHRFVMDYLLEEVLQQQPESIQDLLLHTSILDRMCGPLCDAVLLNSPVAGQTTLDELERSNLFIVPLDNERRWYRYHHLFGDLLRKRLAQRCSPEEIIGLHIHASEWYENNGLFFEAFKHAVAAKDDERAERLMEHQEMPTYLPGVSMTILKWLESLPKNVLNSKPALWWKQAAMMIDSNQMIGVEEKLLAAEAALALKIPPNTEMDEWSRNLVGEIAVARAMLAATRYQAETSMVYANRALEYLHPDNIAYRSSATQFLGFAHYIQGHLDEAEQAYIESLSLAHAVRDHDGILLANTRLGQVLELRNQLHLAAEKYQHALKLIGEDLIPFATVVYLGLARINFEWNDLDTAEKYGELSFQLGLLTEQVIDRPILSQLFMFRLKLTRGDLVGAASFLAQAEQNTRQMDFAVRLPDIAIGQALIHLYQGNIGAAAQVAQQNDIPLIRARVLIKQKDLAAALAVLEPLCQQAEGKGWTRRVLDCMTGQAVAHYANCDQEKAVELLEKVLALAEPEGMVRLFLDEGAPMAELLSVAAAKGIRKNYISKLLAAFEAEIKSEQPAAPVRKSSGLVDPLTPRELEILRFLDNGLSNQQICEQLFLALDTVKGHNRRIFEKLQVHRRTEALARARELGLL